MCNAAAATTSALSIAGSVASTRQQLAKDQAAYDQDLIQNKMAVMKQQYDSQMRSLEAVNNYTQLQIQQQEQNEASAVEKGQVAKDAAQARALAKVMAGESGATGNSQDRILRSIAGSKADAIANLEMSRSSAVGQAEYEKGAAKLRASTAPTYLTQPGKPNKFLAIVGGLTSSAAGVMASTDKYTNIFRTKS